MIRIAIVLLLTLSISAQAKSAEQAKFEKNNGLYPKQVDQTAAKIIQEAHQKAGGDYWVRPETLAMSGYAVFYQAGKAILYDDYRMHRVYTKEKSAAHIADGKVRIEAKKKGDQVFLIAFDGSNTFDMNGLIEDQSAKTHWAASFGFGAIRHALNDGWLQVRLPDDFVDGRLCYFVELTDPSGGVTRFGIDQETKHIRSVGFDTARRWHQRIYSNFFTKPGVSWVQPGRVRLFYDGVKQNEVIWTDFTINKPLPSELFQVKSK